MRGRVFLPWALEFTAIYVVSAGLVYYIVSAYDFCFLYFYFKYLEWLVL